MSKPRSARSTHDLHERLDALTDRLLRAARGEDPADVVAAGLLMLTLSVAQMHSAERKSIFRLMDTVLEGMKRSDSEPGPDRERLN
jgi:hypothetical protein